MRAIVGNDLVDLGHRDARWSHPVERIASRICCPEERIDLSGQEQPEEYLWNLWTAKETAFKVLQRILPGLRFCPPRFRVDRQFGSVRAAGQQVEVTWSRHGDCLHCQGHLGSDRYSLITVHSVVPWRSIANVPGDRLSPRELRSTRTIESWKVRILAKRMIATLIDVHPEELEVVRQPTRLTHSGWSPPEVWHRGRNLEEVCISLSHHGRYGGCVVALGPGRRPEWFGRGADRR